MDCVRELPVKGLCLRRMEDRDIAYVMECMEEAVLRSVSEEERSRRDDWLPRLRAHLANIHDSEPTNEVFILCRDDQREGILWLGRGHDQFTRLPAGFLYGIYVSSEVRNIGLGKWMMTFAEDWCLENGLDRLCLNVGSLNLDAEKAYRRMGFLPRSMVMMKRLR